MPVNYQNGKVYKIINENNKIVYIGSTAQELLCDRYKTHKYKAPNHKIILIENYACNSKQELCMREQQIIEEHSNLLNKQRAYRSEEQKKELDKQSQKEYEEKRKNNPERIEYKKQHSKEYREKNKEKDKEWDKKKYEKRKEYLSQKITCDFCNCEFSRSYLKSHQKRKHNI